MARIAFAWELGGELGHASSCTALARSLVLRGHQVMFVFRELRALSALKETAGFDAYQAPYLLEEGIGNRVPHSYADILLGCGFAAGETLATLVAAWRSLFTRWKADFLVEDFAPTALLAAHAMGLPRARYGNGFAIAPRLSPLPAFRAGGEVDAASVAASDAHALASVNDAMARLGAEPLARLADAFACDEEFLCTFPELDQYGVRGVSGYWGPRMQVSLGARRAWPAGPGKRVFVYLKAGMQHLDALIDGLVAANCRVLAYVPGLDEARRARLAGPRRIVSRDPIRLEGILADCDLVVSQAGNLAAGSVMSGVPQLLFPGHYEQALTAARIAQAGAGLWIGPGDGPETVGPALQAVLGDARFLAGARALSARYPAWSPAEQHRRIVLRIEQLVSPRILSRPSNAQDRTP